LSWKVSVPFWGPTLVGVNAIAIVHRPSGCTVAPLQVSVPALAVPGVNAPTTTTPLIESGIVPDVLVSVIV
jgi:hypothetical protein